MRVKLLRAHRERDDQNYGETSQYAHGNPPVASGYRTGSVEEFGGSNAWVSESALDCAVTK
jgi:hypothetical protein